MTIPVTIFQQRTIADTQADWAQTVTFNQFDPATASLQDAIITTAGSIDASASIENLAPVAATINLGVAAAINATAAGISNVASMTPEAVASVNLGAFKGTFDGTLDFSGPSGTILPDLTASEAQAGIISPGLAGIGTPVAIAPLLGTGTFDVNVSTYATSTVEGNGNLAVLLHGSVGATVSLRYDAVAASDASSSNGSAASYLVAIGGGWPWFGPLTGIDNRVTTTPQVVSLPSQTSGWTATAPFSQFDPSLGVLDEIFLNAGNTLTGTFSAENLEGGPAYVSMDENVHMTVAIPGSPSGIVTNASNDDSASLGAYDGSTDFAGASGKSDTQTSGSGSELPANVTLTDAADLAAFTGTGTIALPVSTAGTSTVTGPSNLLEEITQQTGGTVSVTYIYTPFTGTRQEPVAPSGIAGQNAGALTAGAPWAANAPQMTFIGADLYNGWAFTQPGQTLLIGSGASLTIADFSLTDGDKLNLNSILGGAPLAHDLSNLGSFLGVTGQTANVLGGTDTTLAVSGPGGAASLVLFNSGSISLLDLVSNNVLVLPPH
jgi:hypothetical protein